MMNSVMLVILAAILVCINAAPVNQMCSSNGDLFAYCDQTSMTEIDINELYVESDRITDVLTDLCLNYNDIVSYIFLIKVLFNNVNHV